MSRSTMIIAERLLEMKTAEENGSPRLMKRASQEDGVRKKSSGSFKIPEKLPIDEISKLINKDVAEPVVAPPNTPITSKQDEEIANCKSSPM